MMKAGKFDIGVSEISVLRNTNFPTIGMFLGTFHRGKKQKTSNVFHVPFTICSLFSRGVISSFNSLIHNLMNQNNKEQKMAFQCRARLPGSGPGCSVSRAEAFMIGL